MDNPPDFIYLYFRQFEGFWRLFIFSVKTANGTCYWYNACFTQELDNLISYAVLFVLFDHFFVFWCTYNRPDKLKVNAFRASYFPSNLQASET